jgi:CheY-like chemotaxis protein
MTRILLIEDEIGAIAALKRVLSRSGFEVLIATNAPDAISMAQNEQPRAIVLSGELQSGESGMLHASLDDGDSGRPLVLLGGSAGGGALWLPRPVDGAELAEMLRTALDGGTSATAVERTLVGPAPTEPPQEELPAPFEEPRPEPEPAKPEPPRPATPRQPAAVAPAPAPEPVRAAEAPKSAAAQPSPAAARAFAARRELEAARIQAEQAARRKAEAMGKAAELRRQELQARKEAPSISAVAPLLPAPAAQPSPPPEPPASSAALAAHLFDDLEEPIAAAPKTRRPAAESLPAASPALELDVPVEGELDRHEPALLLVACHRAHWSGRLSLHQGGVQRAIYWEEGRIRGASSTAADEQLEMLAYRRGLLTREQQRQIRAAGQLGARRAALLMVERTFLKPAELFPLVQERVEEIAYAACGSLEGSYDLSPVQVPGDERVSLSRPLLTVVTEAIRRKYLMERLLERMGGPATLLRPVEAGAPELVEFGLSARERRLAQAVDGLRNVEELLFESGFEPLAGLQVLHALVLGHFVEVAVRGLAADLAPEIELAIDLGRVAEKYEQVRTANYFEVLGLPAEATRYEVQQSYERLQREFHPDRYGSIKDPVVRDRLEEIQRVLAEARDILADDALRDEYARHRRRQE